MPRQNRPKLYAPIPKCDGKNRYASQREAEQVREEQELLVPGLQLKTYRCTAGCGGWHLTRTEQ